MKGVLFSADFAIDENDDPRLLELNTDTVIYASFTSSINILSFAVEIPKLSGSILMCEVSSLKQEDRNIHKNN